MSSSATVPPPVAAPRALPARGAPAAVFGRLINATPTGPGSRVRCEDQALWGGSGRRLDPGPPGPGNGNRDGRRLVAGKATAGASSEEVATVLFLSPRTVDAPLRNVYRTPGLSSRRRLREMPLYPSGAIVRNRPGYAVFADVPVPFGAATSVPAIRASAPEAETQAQ